MKEIFCQISICYQILRPQHETSQKVCSPVAVNSKKFQKEFYAGMIFTANFFITSKEVFFFLTFNIQNFKGEKKHISGSNLAGKMKNVQDPTGNRHTLYKRGRTIDISYLD
jgi:hypothetical protein